MYIPQYHLDKLRSLSSKKVTIIFGPRRVGKTTLIKKFLEDQQDYLFVTGEDMIVQKQLSGLSLEKLKNFIGNKKLLVIDEAQYIPQIGMTLKLIIDHIDNVRVIATGSSTFDLAKQVGEPLTGRQYIIRMFPISQIELNKVEDTVQTESLLESRLIYGSYPEVITDRDREVRKEYLRELVSSYLFKDILAFDGIKKSKKMLDLLTLIAFQIGKEVSHSELATQLSLNKGTIERYLDLLEQVFVLVNIRGFSRNLRKEVTKMSRYYFYDNGIRNALINNFNTLSYRNDVGMLWENYIVMERIKKQHFHSIHSNNYFWRTYDQKELDWLEEREGKLFGYEFKWNHTKAKAPKLWLDTYPNASFECINKANYLEFIS
ncbi:AAA family ATPase [Candidatus Aerophobetes bacterium]|uniref:AAA family ATPase n=1 Tax=Aerophobetes bacterium TaxID=2030807 RepID=A0A2A4YLF3_UNCAE|nr:MAG: AAA family ATPase [Candidatus Aerophobetes bacterium]